MCPAYPQAGQLRAAQRGVSRPAQRGEGVPRLAREGTLWRGSGVPERARIAGGADAANDFREIARAYADAFR